MSPRGEAGRGRKRLSEESIISNALELVDTQGVDAMTMRALAERLQVQPMAFYHHFPNKNALLDGVTDQVLASIEIPPLDLEWETWTRQFLHRMKEALVVHPNRVELILARPGTGADYANMLGGFVGTLAREEVDPPFIHSVWHLLISYMLGYLQQFHATVRTLDRGPRPTNGPASNLALIAREIQTCDDDHEFEVGLDLIIQAIASRIQDNPDPQQVVTRRQS